MWRNSLSFSSKLIISHSPVSSSAANVVVRPLFLYQAESFLNYSSSASSPSLSDSIKVGLQRSQDGVRAVSASSVDISSLAAYSVKKASDLARHFGQCYWELSKARLRYAFNLLFSYVKLPSCDFLFLVFLLLIMRSVCSNG